MTNFTKEFFSSNQYLSHVDILKLNNLKTWKAYKTAIGEKISRKCDEELIDLLQRRLDTSDGDIFRSGEWILDCGGNIVNPHREIVFFDLDYYIEHPTQEVEGDFFYPEGVIEGAGDIPDFEGYSKCVEEKGKDAIHQPWY